MRQESISVYQVKLDYTSYKIEFFVGVVVNAPDEGKCMIGKSFARVRSWVAHNGGTLVKIEKQKKMPPL